MLFTLVRYADPIEWRADTDGLARASKTLHDDTSRLWNANRLHELPQGWSVPIHPMRKHGALYDASELPGASSTLTTCPFHLTPSSPSGPKSTRSCALGNLRTRDPSSLYSSNSHIRPFKTCSRTCTSTPSVSLHSPSVGTLHPTGASEPATLWSARPPSSSITSAFTELSWSRNSAEPGKSGSSSRSKISRSSFVRSRYTVFSSN